MTHVHHDCKLNDQLLDAILLDGTNKEKSTPLSQSKKFLIFSVLWKNSSR